MATPSPAPIRGDPAGDDADRSADDHEPDRDGGPVGGRGRYRVDEIEQVLVTAYTAFRAAVLESARSLGPGCPVVVHTGFWGCGAFGGNRVLMTRFRWPPPAMAGVERTVVSHRRPVR